MTIKDDVLKQIKEYHNVSEKDKYKLISSINDIVREIDKDFPNKEKEMKHKLNLFKKDITNELVNLKLTNNLNNYTVSLWTYQIRYHFYDAYSNEILDKLGFLKNFNFDFLINELLGNGINNNKIEQEEIDIEKQLNDKINIDLSYNDEHFDEATIKLFYSKDDYDLVYSETVYSPDGRYLNETNNWKYKYDYQLKLNDKKLIDILDKEGIDAKIVDNDYVDITLRE